MAREDGALGWKQTAIDCSLYANADESLGYKPQQDERRGMTVHGKQHLWLRQWSARVDLPGFLGIEARLITITRALCRQAAREIGMKSAQVRG
jgi:hypothetical protein